MIYRDFNGKKLSLLGFGAMGLDIPLLLATYNEVRFVSAINVGMRVGRHM